ncbi:hypothetical protein [Truepera radiovictrix]|uniref:Outer membrane protein beta-barrel domain-containing protein n=1 Tax=Truepera radiovictrix (strain DSM 17093 / CIP 108686 / LMG 22925 / RQ-24) TaxID=649638 RepID=D7CVZ5_TRURR|nr:hypothetical protein [Truepera radiovictrix]ADI14258.1 hypothetical protein Trad_1131 [Truepera radiovictrix DSM 17093]WMT57185.1 hypothetical protein RCV51_14345 [Truepera radiovictrix]
MKRAALLVWLVGFLWLSAASAQVQSPQPRGAYVGLGVSYAPVGLPSFPPLPALHVGGPLTDTLTVRGTLETLLVASQLGVDFLYTFSQAPTYELYAGVGASASFYFYFPSGSDLRVILGGQYVVDEEPYLGAPRPFGEVRTYVRSFAGLSAGFWPTLEGCFGVAFPL